MSLMQTIRADVDAIFGADEFAQTHNVNGREMRAIVHGAAFGNLATAIEFAVNKIDTFCIVKVEDYGAMPPQIDSIFTIDGRRYRVEQVTLIGKTAHKIALSMARG